MKFYGIESINPIEIGTPSNDNSLTNLLAWDPSDGQIKYRESSSISGGGSSSQNLSQVLQTGNNTGTYSINFIDNNSKIYGIVAGTSFFGWSSSMSSILAMTSSAFVFRPDTSQQLSGLSVLNSIIGGVEYFYPGSGRSQHAWLMTKGSNDNITSKTELCTNILSQCVCDSLNNCLSYLSLQSSTVNLYSCQGASNYSLQFMTPTYICKMTSIGTTTSIFSLGNCNQSIRLSTNDLTFTNEVVINPDMVQLNGVSGADGQVFSVNSTGQLCWQTVSGGGGSTQAPTSEIVFGSGTGVTSSSLFKFDIVNNSLIVSYAHTIDSTSLNSSIIGGASGQCIYDSSCNTSILGGYSNKISNSSCNSAVVGGNTNVIHYCTRNSSILGGQGNHIYHNNYRSVILGGSGNSTCCESLDTINSGFGNIVKFSQASSVIGGYQNQLYGYNASYKNNQSSIIGGKLNRITTIVASTGLSSVIGGQYNCVCGTIINNSIIGGELNVITSIYGGATNYCSVRHSAMLMRQYLINL